jgi:hypothetical protein
LRYGRTKANNGQKATQYLELGIFLALNVNSSGCNIKFIALQVFTVPAVKEALKRGNFACWNSGVLLQIE